MFFTLNKYPKRNIMKKLMILFVAGLFILANVRLSSRNLIYCQISKEGGIPLMKALS
jgi:hypothetical protein